MATRRVHLTYEARAAINRAGIRPAQTIVAHQGREVNIPMFREADLEQFGPFEDADDGVLVYA